MPFKVHLTALLLLASINSAHAYEVNKPATKSLAAPNTAVATTPEQKWISKIDDERCDTFVEPFELTRNITDLSFSQLPVLIKDMLTNGKIASDKYEMFRLAAKRMNWLPMPLEQKYGKLLHKHKSEQIKILPRAKYKKEYALVDSVMSELKQRLPEGQPYDFKVFIVDSNEKNASALPGGYLYIDKGATKSSGKNKNNSKDLVAFLLSHEIAHVSKRHQTKELQSRLIDATTTFQELKGILDGNLAPGEIIKKTITTVKTAKDIFHLHTLDEEHQADVCAARLLYTVKSIDLTKGLKEFLNPSESMTSTDVSNKDTEHPSYPARAKVLYDSLVYFQTNQPDISMKNIGPTDKINVLPPTASGSSALDNTPRHPGHAD